MSPPSLLIRVGNYDIIQNINVCVSVYAWPCIGINSGLSVKTQILPPAGPWI